MENVDHLLAVVDLLLGENGCPWDREQTMKSIRQDLLEEVSELIEAIDSEDNQHIEEELGDLFFNVIFLGRLAEKEGRTDLNKVLHLITEKLIRRHPHVFCDEKIEPSEELLKRWDQIKLTEKGKEKRTSILDGIPKSLPALARFQKIAKKIKKTEFCGLPQPITHEFIDEKEFGKYLGRVVLKGIEQGLDAEHALKNYLVEIESDFRTFEK